MHVNHPSNSLGHAFSMKGILLGMRGGENWCLMLTVHKQVVSISVVINFHGEKEQSGKNIYKGYVGGQ